MHDASLDVYHHSWQWMKIIDGFVDEECFFSLKLLSYICRKSLISVGKVKCLFRKLFHLIWTPILYYGIDCMVVIFGMCDKSKSSKSGNMSKLLFSISTLRTAYSIQTSLEPLRVLFRCCLRICSKKYILHGRNYQTWSTFVIRGWKRSLIRL